jgi:predicted RNase H-like nuclease
MRLDVDLARIKSVGTGQHLEQQGVVPNIGGHRPGGKGVDLIVDQISAGVSAANMQAAAAVPAIRAVNTPTSSAKPSQCWLSD